MFCVFPNYKIHIYLASVDGGAAATVNSYSYFFCVTTSGSSDPGESVLFIKNTSVGFSMSSTGSGANENTLGDICMVTSGVVVFRSVFVSQSLYI